MVCVTAGAAAIGMALGGVSAPSPNEIHSPSAATETTQSEVVTTSQGPRSGEFKAWTRGQANGTQVKFYAKYPQPGQKIQFMAQNGNGAWREIGWKRIGSSDLDASGNYRGLTNEIYFVRTFDLTPGSFNRLRVDVDGKTVWGSVRASWRPAVFGDVEPCKIKENSRMRKPGDPVLDYTGQREIRGRYNGNATAFPFAPTSLPIIGEINVALIYVDWSDLPGTQADYRYYEQQVKMFEDFYWMVSENKLKMNIHKSDKWFRIAGSYQQLTLNFDEEAQRGEAPRKQVFYDAAVKAADPETDFSDIDIVFFAIPRAKSVFSHGGPHEFNFDWNGYLKTEERDIYDTTTPGDWFLKNDAYEPPWVNYVHEVGHMIGIPHQANEDLKQEGRIWLQNPLNGYDIMANQGGASRTMTSWLRWLAGWLNDDQVACITKEQVTDNYFELHPINQVEGKVESLVIKLSETKAVVVESRRFDPYFDRKTNHSKTGLLVYTVDATKASAQGNQALLSPRDITKYIEEPNWRSWAELDAVFFQGDSVEIEGLRIEAFAIGKASDVVRVSRVTN
jgi:M6 family metalloprotease-like protein